MSWEKIEDHLFNKYDVEGEDKELSELMEEHDKQVKAKAIDKFTHQLKETLNQEFPSNYESTRPYFSLENARLIVDDVAEQMRKEV